MHSANFTISHNNMTPVSAHGHGIYVLVNYMAH